MINKRLLNLVPEVKGLLVWSVVLKWMAFIGNIGFIIAMVQLVVPLLLKETERIGIIWVAVMVLSGGIRLVSSSMSRKMVFRMSALIKYELRHQLYARVLQAGLEYQELYSSAALTQLAVEGIEQLDQVVSQFYPQFFYCMAASLSLFTILSFYHLQAALVLLVCLPLIPLSIVVIQKLAKRLLKKYWGLYTDLGDHFLENLEGLVTLKSYGADALKAKQMDEDAEKFRRVTMRVLIMQLNSIGMMDIVAYGGAALTILVALGAYSQGSLSLAGVLIFILASAEFFIPLRQLGSFFHVAMNGNTASEKIFAVLDTPLPVRGDQTIDSIFSVSAKEVSFSYGDQPVLSRISFDIEGPGLVGIVGASGSGKSTIMKLLTQQITADEGTLSVNHHHVTAIRPESLLKQLCVISYDAFVFQGTLKENLAMACHASDDAMMAVLKQVNLLDFVLASGGLDMQIQENGSNLSGGQKQRIALARGLLMDASLYLFDEATSNIDVESETAILEVIDELAMRKPLIMIAHRLRNVQQAKQILVLDQHRIVETGRHEELMALKGRYAELVESQEQYETVLEGGYHD